MDTQAFFLLLYDVTRTMADELVLATQRDDQLRHAPYENHYSLAWRLWQSTRWEDLAGTMLEEDASPVFEQKGWFAYLGVEHRNAGLLMHAEECRLFNLHINLPALRLYRADVEQRTRLIVEASCGKDLEELVREEHFHRTMETGGLGNQGTPWLERFLGNRSKAWWLSSIIWHHSACLLGEAAHLRRQSEPFQPTAQNWPF